MKMIILVITNIKKEKQKTKNKKQPFKREKS